MEKSPSGPIKIQQSLLGVYSLLNSNLGIDESQYAMNFCEQLQSEMKFFRGVIESICGKVALSDCFIADIAIFSGNPLEIFSETLYTIIDGEIIYEKRHST